jgi:hypothetical protein
MSGIPITLAVEDDLSEALLRELLQQSGQQFIIGACLKHHGFGYLKKILPGLNQAAKGMPYIVLTDLDRHACPMALLQSWLSQPKHHNLIFRVAVIEVEAWLMADRQAFADFLGISLSLIPDNLDVVNDPKKLLIELVGRSRKRSLREAIIPAKNSTAKIGKDYNGQLIRFINECWQANAAIAHSPSLKRAVSAIHHFQPIYSA